MSGWLIVGVGNRFRGDDAVGIHAADALERLGMPDVQVRKLRGEGLDLVDTLSTGERVIVIDAANSGSEPGTVHYFDAASQKIPAIFTTGSTHTAGLGEAIELSRALGKLPSELLIFGIEGKHFAMGEGLSAEVARAIPTVVERIKRRIGDA